MNDWQLKIFISTCLNGSMNAAAHELMTSAVTVKSQVDSLERELGATLLNRSPSGCTPTPEGLKALAAAQSILRTFEHVRQDISGRRIIRACETKDLPHAFQDIVALELAQLIPPIEVKRVFLPRSKWEYAVATGQADVCQTLRGAIVDGLPKELTTSRACLPETQVIRYPQTFRAVCLMSPLSEEATALEISAESLRGHEVLVDSLMYETGCLDQLFCLYGVNARAEDAVENHQFAVEACMAGAIIVTAEMFKTLYPPLVAVPLADYRTWVTLLVRTDCLPHLQAYIESSKRAFASLLP